jgi:beta-mannanase
MKKTAMMILCIVAAAFLFAGPASAETNPPTSPADAAATRYRSFLPLMSITSAQTPSSSGRAYWGVSMQDVPWDMNKLAAWESAEGKQVSIVHYWQFWKQSGAMQRFSSSIATNVRNHGAIPMISWPPMNMGGPAGQSDFQLADIINGAYDGYIRQWATDAKAWGSPFFLRVAHEMNGYWFPWSEIANGNSRGQFVQAWRHIHDVFTSVGARNVTWVWCPNIVFAGSSWPSLASLYPGDAYVDWTCTDGYNWGPDYPTNGGWMNFKDLFGYTYDELAKVAPNKPMMIGECASTETGGSKAEWIMDALGTQLPKTFPRIRAVLWYNWVMDSVDWRVESSQYSVNGFKSAIGSSYYVPAKPGGYTASPIPAP